MTFSESEEAAIKSLQDLHGMSRKAVLRNALRHYQFSARRAADGYYVRYLNEAGEQHPEDVPVGLPVVE